MADFKATPAQLNAIGTRNSAVLVSAGAGSGKTKVLTERLIEYITDPENPADIDTFLIITYTKAAAGELKGRIMQELARVAEQDPGNKRLRRQSALCAKAQIGTIHSFCSNILRQNCHELGLSPDFKVVDDERAKDMKNAAMDKILEERYSDMDRYPGFKELVDTVGSGRNDNGLAELVLEFHNNVQSHARPEKWIAQQINVFDSEITDIADTVWGREIMNSARSKAAYWLAEMEKCLGELNDEALHKNYENVENTVCSIRRLSEALDSSWDSACDCFPVVFDRWTPYPKEYKDIPELENVKNKRNKCKDALKKIEEMFLQKSAVYISDFKMTAGSMKALLNLTLDFDKKYAADKKRAAVLDYSDLEHFAAKLLTDEDENPTPIAKKISEKLTEIMVDEYQDVSRVQDTIFKAISKNGSNLFMVGDVKQAIYRFRLADPAIFAEKYTAFEYADKAEEGQARKILLRENFRSRHEILDAANTVFSTCMSEELGNVKYDEDAALICGARYAGEVSHPEILLRAKETDDNDENTAEDAELEAEIIADKIKELVSSGTMVGTEGSERPMGYKDAAILLRSLKNAEAYRKVLMERGIPVSFSGGEFYNTLEISMVMSLLTITDNPHQDIPLLTVLRSPAFGFSADELASIKNADRKAEDLYTAMVTAAENDEKCENVLRRLKKFRVLAPDMSPSQLVWYVINELDLMAVCSAMNDGIQRREHLMQLVDIAKQYEATGYKGLHRFILWISSMASSGKNPSSAVAADAVQILTIHKSKGLEFPVVFIANANKKFNMDDMKKKVLVHPELGLGPTCCDAARHISYPTFAKNAIKQRITRETISEEMRLLYVAMTRPKERLFITAVMKDPYKLLDTCFADSASPMDPEILYGANNYLKWLIYSAQADNEEHLGIKVVGSAEKVKAAEKSIEETAADIAIYDEICDRLSFEYEYKAAQSIPAKVTPTELKHMQTPDEDAHSIAPKFKKSFKLPQLYKDTKPATGTERGIATHHVLQYMCFDRTDTAAQIKEEIARLESQHFITGREAECVDAEAIYKLFSSELGKRMKTAGNNILREFKFSLLKDAGEIFEDAAGEQILMQGVVDCCIEENGELVIIDYKTDSVKTVSEIEERTRLYAGQVKVYAEAMERISGKKVKECVLYYLKAGAASSVARS